MNKIFTFLAIVFLLIGVSFAQSGMCFGGGCAIGTTYGGILLLPLQRLSTLLSAPLLVSKTGLMLQQFQHMSGHCVIWLMELQILLQMPS